MAEIDAIKKGSLFPYLSFEFFDEDGEHIDCSLFQVILLVQNRHGATVIRAVVGEENSGAIWINEDQGIGEYQWKTGDTDILGRYKYEFKLIRLHDDKPFRIPESDYFYYLVRDDIADVVI